MGFEPFSDGLGLMRDAQTAKPQSFRTGDGWFAYNLAVNLAQISGASPGETDPGFCASVCSPTSGSLETTRGRGTQQGCPGQPERPFAILGQQ